MNDTSGRAMSVEVVSFDFQCRSCHRITPGQIKDPRRGKHRITCPECSVTVEVSLTELRGMGRAQTRRNTQMARLAQRTPDCHDRLSDGETIYATCELRSGHSGRHREHGVIDGKTFVVFWSKESSEGAS